MRIWDPTNAKLNTIYRSRLADRNLKEIYRKQMDVLSSSFRDRFVELDLLRSEDPDVDEHIDYTVKVEFGVCNLDLTLVSYS
jgi:hypothetical protein